MIMTVWHSDWNMNTRGLDIFDTFESDGIVTQGIEIDARPYPAMRSIEHITMPITAPAGWPDTPQAAQIFAAAEVTRRHEQRVNRAARILCFLAAVANLVFGFAIVGQGGDTPAVTTVLAELALVVGGGTFVALIFALTE
jgi:hypothetical protein